MTEQSAVLILDRGINDLMQKAYDGDCSEFELNFLKNLYQDLGECLEEVENLKN